MTPRWICLLVLGACGFQHGAASGDGAIAPQGDGSRMIDARPVDARPLDGAPSVPIVFVNQAHGQFSDATHNQLSVGIANQVAGDTNVVVVSWFTPLATINALMDTSGNNYTLIGEISDGTSIQRMYYAVPIAASSNNLITVTCTQNCQFIELRICEYSGIASANTVEGSTSNTGSGGTESTGTLAITGPHDLLVAAFTGNVNNNGQGTGWTQRISFVGDYVEDKVVTAPGMYTGDAAGGPGNWIAMIAALRGIN